MCVVKGGEHGKHIVVRLSSKHMARRASEGRASGAACRTRRTWSGA